MNSILLIILLLLLCYILGMDGLKLFVTLCINFLLVLGTFILIAIGLNPVMVGLFCCILVSFIIIYRVCDEKIKKYSSLISTILVLLFLSIFIYIITICARTYGFGYESFEEINMFSYNINVDFSMVEVALVLIGLVGAIVDAAVSISSALYEIYENNKKLSSSELYKSGLNIGRDILGTTVNTLLFAFLGEGITLLVWLYGFNYSFLALINNKTLIAEIFKILFSIFGSLMVIPLTSYVASCLLVGKCWNCKVKRK